MYGAKHNNKVIFVEPNEDILAIPEHNLLIGLINNAIWDLGSKDTGIKGNARRWLLSNNDTEFSFRWCCHALDVDPVKTLQKIRRLVYAEKAKIL